MATIRFLLENRYQRKDGTYPLVLRITHNGAYKQKKLGVNLPLAKWDSAKQRVRKSYPSSQEINLRLDGLRAKYSSKLLGQIENEEIDLGTILSGITKSSKVTFDQVKEQVIGHLEDMGKHGNARAYRDSLRKFSSIMGFNRLSISQVTPPTVHKYINRLTAEDLSPNTVSFHLRTLKAFLSMSVKMGYVDSGAIQDLAGVTVKRQETLKRALPPQVMHSLANVRLTHPKEQWARDIFLLIYALIGISFVDLAYLKPASIMGGRVNYYRRKTGKLYSVKLFPATERLIERVGLGDNYLLSILQGYEHAGARKSLSRIRTVNKQVNFWLERVAQHTGIKEKITTYVARHTWANCAKLSGYSYEMISEALGHSYGSPVTQIYLASFEAIAIDNMNRCLLNQLNYVQEGRPQ